MSDEIITDIPMWMLRGLFKARGAQLSKLKLLEPRSPRMLFHGTCNKQKVITRRNVVSQLHELFCTQCFQVTTESFVSPNPFDKKLVDVFGSRMLPAHYQTKGKPKLTVKDLAKGNLSNNEEYRFLVGMAYSQGCRVVCRACRAMMFTDEQRLKHKEMVVKGDPCTVWLVKAYKLLLPLKKCVVCQNLATLKPWGVPLCSVQCVQHWRFGTTDWAPIRAALIEAGWPSQWPKHDWTVIGAIVDDWNDLGAGVK